MDAFKEAVRVLPLEATAQPTPHVRFTSLRGAVMEVTYGETPRVDDVPVDYAGWPLFDGPFLQAAPAGGWRCAADRCAAGSTSTRSPSRIGLTNRQI